MERMPGVLDDRWCGSRVAARGRSEPVAVGRSRRSRRTSTVAGVGRPESEVKQSVDATDYQW